MFNKLDILNVAQGMAVHAAKRQSVIARNVANADTPGYHAQDIGAFAEAFRGTSNKSTMRSTRAGHLLGPELSAGPAALQDAGGEASPSGNTVSLEKEMMRSSEVRHQYDLALSVYSKSLGILRASLGRG